MEWNKISDRKWELKRNDLVLATIFHKPNNKFSLFIQAPRTYKRIISVAAETYLYDNLEDAKSGFLDIMHEHIIPYAATMLAFWFNRDIRFEIDHE